MKALDIAVTVLLVVGALNWGLVGFLDYNLIGALFGETAPLARVFYAFIGLSGLYEAYNFTFGYNEMHHRWCELSSIKH